MLYIFKEKSKSGRTTLKAGYHLQIEERINGMACDATVIAP